MQLFPLVCQAVRELTLMRYLGVKLTCDFVIRHLLMRDDGSEA